MITVVVVVCEEDVERLICEYAPQSGGDSLCDEVNGEWDVHGAGYLVMCLVDIYVHVVSHIDGFYGWVGSWRARHMSRESCR